MSSDPAPTKGPLAARAAAILAFASALLIAGGPGAAHVRLLAPLQGFSAFGLGLLIGVAGMLSGVWGAIAARRKAYSARWPLVAVAWGVVVLALGVAGVAPARGKPRINDITTDTEEPPRFSALAQRPANAGRDMSYPRAFAEKQRTAYPELQTFVVDLDARTAIERARAAAASLGWVIARVDEDGFEATHESGVFRFVDDVRVRVRPGEAGAIIDVRSKSRDGKGDLGANARRIRAFFERFKEG